ncbi:MAG: ferredoxin:glutaredoxin reductase [Methanomicrobiales archaeon HGW-Methanomicrobiales-1]|jgi:ferredoxin-thioredoxin reductase catalytic subunit|nr:MAG: ferredoxin:glutaredoxin reductase [Methanomicrobiales archaeon HGW-Methanomicrobiales-1]
MPLIEIKPEDVEATYQILQKEAKEGGYLLNPDAEFTKNLITGLMKNERRYGYRACPCRLASGKKAEDLDIICPCDYRDPDLNAFDTCYCALYVSDDIANGRKKIQPVPERRPPRSVRAKTAATHTVPLAKVPAPVLSFPVWRCKVCGYLCARDQPPEICPICKVTKDRFERFM